jgi:hypothetical protein
MAILYGKGDFMKTVGIAVSAGYDCDNQAATCAGLIGVLQGTKCLPPEIVEKFNNQYVCFTRDDVPIATPLSEIEERIAAIAKRAILDNGGRIEIRRGDAPSIIGKTLKSEFDDVEFTWVFGYDGALTVSGGKFEDNTTASYEQDGANIRIKLFGENLDGFYDGETLKIDDGIYGEITYIIKSDF